MRKVITVIQNFNSNRFNVDAENADAVRTLLAMLHADEIVVGEKESTDDDGNVAAIRFHIHGTGNLTYPADGVSEGMLKLTGNMDAFYSEMQQFVSDGSAMLLMQTTIDDDGWLGARGVTVSRESVIKHDLAGSLIASAADAVGDEHWKTDFHAI